MSTSPDDEPEGDTGELVYALAAATSEIFFAASATGLRRSTDGGASWKDAYSLLKPPEPLATLAVAASPNFAKDKTVAAGVAGGALVSADGGRKWEARLFPLPDCAVTALAFSPNFAHDGVLLAGTLQDGFFRSTDRGRLWTSASFGLLDLGILCLAAAPTFATDETAWIGTSSGLYRSTNGGRSWREANFPIDAAPVLCLATSPNYAADQTVLAGTETGRLMRSTDAGLNWAPLGPALLDGPVNALLPRGDRLVALVDETIMETADAGHTWTPWPNADGVSAVLAVGERVLAGGVDGSVAWVQP